MYRVTKASVTADVWKKNYLDAVGIYTYGQHENLSYDLKKIVLNKK